MPVLPLNPQCLQLVTEMPGSTPEATQFQTTVTKINSVRKGKEVCVSMFYETSGQVMITLVSVIKKISKLPAQRTTTYSIKFISLRKQISG